MRFRYSLNCLDQARKIGSILNIFTLLIYFCLLLSQKTDLSELEGGINTI
jgi:hypothetical protein